MLAEEKEAEKDTDQRASVEADNSPVSQHHPTDPPSSSPAFTRLHKSTCRSHYCSPSSMFTGMLKIVITSVRTEIFNLDVFFNKHTQLWRREKQSEKRQMLALRREV